MKAKTIILLMLPALFIIGACKTVPPVIPEDLHPSEFFQRAQEASNNGKYSNALIYYNTFLERYPDDIQREVEAEYEIAFIAYKQKQYEKAKQLFEELLKKYSPDASQILPAWPKVLAQKVLSDLKEKQ